MASSNVIRDFDSQNLKLWINSSNELTSQQKQTICNAIDLTGCTGNTLLQATGPEDIKEELRITTLLSRQLFKLIFPTHEEQKDANQPIINEILMANLELNYNAQIAPQKFNTHTIRMNIHYATMPTVHVTQHLKPAYFHHFHPVTWQQIMGKFMHIWYQKHNEYNKLRQEIHGYFNEIETWATPETSTANIEWIPLLLCIVGVVGTIVGPILLGHDQFFIAGLIVTLAGPGCLLTSIFLCIEADNWCCGLCTIGNTLPARSGQGLVKKNPSQEDIKRVKEIRLMYDENTMNRLEKLMTDLNNEYEGYVKFTKQIISEYGYNQYTHEMNDGYEDVAHKRVDITIHQYIFYQIPPPPPQQNTPPCQFDKKLNF